MDYIDALGPIALGSRLRRLSERLTADAGLVHKLYQVDADARWYPVIRLLADSSALAVGHIAETLGQSHASIVQVLNGMQKAGLVHRERSRKDRRVSSVSLSAKGRRQALRLVEQSAQVARVIDGMLDADANLWDALRAFEAALDAGSFHERVLHARSQQQLPRVRLIDYAPAHRAAFARLNYAWIQELFVVEDADRRALDDPQAYILGRGGAIVLARENRRIIGTGALLRMDERSLELAKMAVDPAARGRGVGLLIGAECVLRARRMGARRLYLETNSSLTPAIALYEKLGFRRVRGGVSPYARADVQMELLLG